MIRGALLLLAATAGAPTHVPPPVTAPDSGAVTVPVKPVAMPTDSAAVRGDAEDATGAVGDSLAAQLVRLGARRDRLTSTGRRVLDELIAAARQMADDGDLDAALLIAADARQWIEQQGR